MGEPVKAKAKAGRLEAWRQRRRAKREVTDRPEEPGRDRPEGAKQYDEAALQRLGERTGIFG